MNQIYRFADWTSASRMKNEVDPCLKIDVGVMLDTDNQTIVGHQITVYRERIDKILYRFYVDVGLPNTWSLTTDEAIILLNQIGFPCEWQGKTYNISKNVRITLESLKNLGYTHIRRTIRPARVFAINGPLNVEKDFKELEIVYNYYDYHEFDDTPTRIDGII